ncbi:hypothetical protein EPA93_02125 [Ktedonosporobacter rubrisoli]|uniref:Uncharacterized protein n=1 Tax=Ktedonosporobacter rubrisoli TaxID=2509675 RepID=A0A4P6JIG1_KTERU|nr:ECF transporter S component [Ktedonosporobacter rubrisoli]QBD74854.1 hypothetical protein EPA93_02125 [Ktedonosporobacter rubrisoli]
MSTSSSSVRRHLFAWSTREILLIAAIGIVFGMIFAASYYAFSITVVFGPIAGWAWTGLYLLPSLLIGYILRRPGAALLISLLYSLVTLLFSPYGPVILINCAFYAVSGEVGLALGTRYRSFSLPWMILSGILSGLVMILLYVIFYRDSFLEWALPIRIGVVGITILTGIVGAIIGKQLADALARTGALAGTALKNDGTHEV